MKKIILPLMILMFLTGCSSPVWETVDDTVEVTVASWLDEAYSIEVGVPQAMTLLDASDGCSIYTNDDGSLEVETRTFLASDLDTAVQMLTGYRASDLNILQTRRFDLPEYQFAWVAQTEQGSRLYRADMVVDGLDHYAVICSTLETIGDTYEADVRQVISTFGLYTDEGV